MYTRPVDLADFDYALPAASIAQAPAERRDASRLLVIDRSLGEWRDRRFADLPHLLRAGDCVILNDSRVIPARVFARAAASDRAVEIVFVAEEERRALAGAGAPRARTAVPAPTSSPEARSASASGWSGWTGTVSRIVERLDGTIPDLMAAHGLPPLPPYIARHRKPAGEDWERYQTVYARHPGSVAAPTAGLHFTPELLEALRARGIEVHALTLHVGVATFRPLRGPELDGARAARRARGAARRGGARRERGARRGTPGGRGRHDHHAGARRPRPASRGRSSRSTARSTSSSGRATCSAPWTRSSRTSTCPAPRSSCWCRPSRAARSSSGAYAHAVRAGYRFYSYGDATLIE